MHIFQQAQNEELTDCPYLGDQRKSYCYFLASRVDAAEMSLLLAQGWRKFGLYFFRPECPQCRNCIPLRVRVADFAPSRSQRRVLRKAQGLEARFGPLRLTDQIYDLYRRHSQGRFDQSADPEDFLYNFYMPSCPALQTELYYNDELIGAGFLDQGSDCLNSVYFFYDPAYAHLHPGTFSILREIEYAKGLGLSFYYLGYYVPGCRRMGYKDHFRPREHYDWSTGVWSEAIGPPEGPVEFQ
ncbi:arginyltransferase [Geoalkalibacter halelectricus]|uniref:Arginyltransferase n=1 Tax=Geoalkalibacter halelectricus TaxID=2847045 RepID=A0ABY5ZKW6_9BACT|nr:arginyltransferase [Geoalkalibacter halelectricus]MDO3379624.1 arginyltransferase [Geoalkalibacter halelectricus]UWZ78560.1 arginyltransferase [Geoalkalibacter halelectricus]